MAEALERIASSTDGRPPIAHCYLSVEVLPPPWTALCGTEQCTAPFVDAPADAMKCIVCLDLDPNQ